MSFGIADSTQAAIVEQDQRRAKEVLAKIESLAKRESMTALELAKLLTEAKENNYHRVKGFSNFEDYIDQAKLGIGKRQAWSYIKIWDGSDKLTISEDELEAAGMTKLKAIFALDIEKFENEIRDLVKRAPEMTVQQVQDEVKALKAPEEDQFGWLNFKMLKEDIEANVQPALALAKANGGNTLDIVNGGSKEISDGQALNDICLSYMQDPNNNADELGQSAGIVDEVEIGEMPDESEEA